MPEQILSCAVSADDGYEANGGAVVFNDDPSIRFGMPNNDEVAAAFRFPLPSTGWLVDKMLTNVALRLTYTGDNNGSFTAKAYLEDGATPGILTTSSGDISGRTKTTAFVYLGSGVLGSPTADEVRSYNGSSSLSFLTIVEEVITSQTAAAMDAIVVIVDYLASSTGGYRDIYAEDHGLVPATGTAPGPPRLVLTYEEPISVDEKNLMFLMTDETDVVV